MLRQHVVGQGTKSILSHSGYCMDSLAPLQNVEQSIAKLASNKLFLTLNMILQHK